MNGIITQILVDTGATSSAISKALLECFPNYKRLINRRSPKTCISVNGQQLKSNFTVILPLIFDGKVIKHEYEVIPNLIHPALIGTDFLKKQEAKIDFASNELQLGEVKIPFVMAEWVPIKPPHLVSSEDVVIEPNTISLIKADIQGNDPRLKEARPDALLIGPGGGMDGLENSVIASYSVINPYLESIWVEMINVSDKPVHIQKGNPIADIQSEDPNIKETGVHRDLQRMPSNLTSDEQTEDYCEGCCVFSTQEDIEKENLDLRTDRTSTDRAANL